MESLSYWKKWDSNIREGVAKNVAIEVRKKVEEEAGKTKTWKKKKTTREEQGPTGGGGKALHFTGDMLREQASS